jgi:predicted RNase H-like nuclease (RuvC/YqgF family)
MVLLTAISSPAFAKPSGKIDAELQKVLEQSSPSEPIAIIVIFQSKPTEEQIDLLKTEHKMNVTYIYEIIDGVAGRAPAEEIPKIAEYEWVKEVWLDRKVYATQDKTVETSQLIDELQRENEELKQTVSNLSQKVAELQEQAQAQQNKIFQLETKLKTYPLITFIAGLTLGAVSVSLMVKTRRRVHTQKT